MPAAGHRKTQTERKVCRSLSAPKSQTVMIVSVLPIKLIDQTTEN
jgi:hypothetical protein